MHRKSRRISTNFYRRQYANARKEPDLTITLFLTLTVPLIGGTSSVAGREPEEDHDAYCRGDGAEEDATRLSAGALATHAMPDTYY